LGIAKGLSYMHNRDSDRPAYHRDIKAANIALTPDLVPKIIDCGLAKYVPETKGAGMSIHTMTGARFGTIGYMCEKYCKRADMAFDGKCEVFSFGIVLLELFTGHLQGSNRDYNLEDMVDDDDELLVPDARAGPWPVEAAKMFIELASECVVKYNKRRSDMRAVVQALSRICSLHQTSARESSLLRTQEQLVAENERLVLQRDVDDRLAQEPKHECVVCYDTFPLSSGVLCDHSNANAHTNANANVNGSEQHFFCDEDFSNMISSQCSHMAPFIKFGCKIVCQMCLAIRVPIGETQVQSPMSLSTLQAHASEEAFASYMAAGLAADRDLEDRKVEAERVMVRERHEDEMQELRDEVIADKVSKLEAATQRHRQRIINDILTLR